MTLGRYNAGTLYVSWYRPHLAWLRDHCPLSWYRPQLAWYRPQNFVVSPTLNSWYRPQNFVVSPTHHTR